MTDSAGQALKMNFRDTTMSRTRCAEKAGITLTAFFWLFPQVAAGTGQTILLDAWNSGLFTLKASDHLVA